MRVYLLNTSILTSYGNYSYIAVQENRVAAELLHYGFTSAIGHTSTAEVLNTILNPYGVDVKTNRISISLKAGDKAFIFKLNDRPPEGRILTVKELEEIGYSFGLITKIA